MALFVVSRILLDRGGAEFLRQAFHRFAGLVALLQQVVPHLRVEAHLLEHDGGVGFRRLGGQVLGGHAMELRQIGVGLGDLGIPAWIIEDRGVGEFPRESLILLLYLTNQPIDHPAASSANRTIAMPFGTGSPPASTRSTSRSTAIATSTSAASGSRVVRRCRARPGHDTMRANLPFW